MTTVLKALQPCFKLAKGLITLDQFNVQRAPSFTYTINGVQHDFEFVADDRADAPAAPTSIRAAGGGRVKPPGSGVLAAGAARVAAPHPAPSRAAANIGLDVGVPADAVVAGQPTGAPTAAPDAGGKAAQAGVAVGGDVAGVSNPQLTAPATVGASIPLVGSQPPFAPGPPAHNPSPLNHQVVQVTADMAELKGVVHVLKGSVQELAAKLTVVIGALEAGKTIAAAVDAGTSEAGFTNNIGPVSVATATMVNLPGAGTTDVGDGVVALAQNITLPAPNTGNVILINEDEVLPSALSEPASGNNRQTRQTSAKVGLY